MAVEDYGIIVGITDYIRGLCPVAHLMDISVKNHRKKFKIGLPVTCKVWIPIPFCFKRWGDLCVCFFGGLGYSNWLAMQVLKVVPEDQRLLLTLKPTLVNSTLPIITAPYEADV